MTKKPHSDIKLFMRLEPDIPHLTHQHGLAPAIAHGKAFMRKTQELKNLEAKYISLLRPFAPAEPWDCPIHLSTIWKFKAPQRLAKTQAMWKTTTPDTDNLVKTLKDCMKKAGYFVDDARVCFDSIVKVYVREDEEHGIEIKLHDLNNPVED